MRLPVVSNLSTKDGSSNKNSRMTNTLVSKSPTGTVFAEVRPGLESITSTLTQSTGNGIVDFNGDLISVFDSQLSLADVDPDPVVSFPAVEVIDGVPAANPGEPEAYPTGIHTGATVEGYSNIVLVGWGIGPNTTQGYTADFYLFRWEETLGYEMLDIEPTLSFSFDFIGGVLSSGDGEILFTQGLVSPETKVKIYKWTRSGGMVLLGPEASIGNDGNNVSGMTKVLGMTPDGSCCVGKFKAISNNSRAFKWTEDDGFVDLDSGMTSSSAESVSDDGLVIAGTYVTGGVTYAGKWTQAAGWVSLGTLGANPSSAGYISADGETIYGYSVNGSSATRAYKWTAAGGMVDLDSASTYTSIFIVDAARGESVVVGGMVIAATGAGNHAFKWDPVNKFVSLVYPSETSGYATSVSDDGTVIVGLSVVAGVKIAWKWTEETGMVSLGTAGTYDYEGYRVSADGTAIAGGAWNVASDYPIYPFVIGGRDVLPRFRDLVDLVDEQMDFAQSTL